MRTAEQIAADLIAALQEVEHHQLLNICGKSTEELIKMQKAYMEACQRLSRLQQERRDWINQ